MQSVAFETCFRHVGRGPRVKFKSRTLEKGTKLSWIIMRMSQIREEASVTFSLCPPTLMSDLKGRHLYNHFKIKFFLKRKVSLGQWLSLSFLRDLCSLAFMPYQSYDLDSSGQLFTNLTDPCQFLARFTVNSAWEMVIFPCWKRKQKLDYRYRSSHIHAWLISWLLRLVITERSEGHLRWLCELCILESAGFMKPSA